MNNHFLCFLVPRIVDSTLSGKYKVHAHSTKNYRHFEGKIRKLEYTSRVQRNFFFFFLIVLLRVGYITRDVNGLVFMLGTGNFKNQVLFHSAPCFFLFVCLFGGKAPHYINRYPT